MAWLECKQCRRKIFQVEGRSPAHDGWCGDCYEQVTGKCADCKGTGQIERAHLGTSECAKCDGTGKAGTE
jgi:hypothetical protein